MADPNDPAVWSYTLGLPTTLNHPEIVVFGLPKDRAHTLLWNLVDEIHGGARFRHGARAEVFPEGRYEATFLDVDPKWFPFMGWAIWYHEGTSFAAVQCAWPDRDHRLPWDSRYGDPRAQPLLISDRNARALGVALPDHSQLLDDGGSVP